MNQVQTVKEEKERKGFAMLSADIQKIACLGGFTGMQKMLGNSGDVWLADMANWTHQPEGYAELAQPGIDREMENFPDYIGHTNADCIAYRDKMLIEILKLHRKL